MPKEDLLPVGEPVPKKETTASEDLASLAAQMGEDDSWTEAEKERVYSAAATMVEAIAQEHRWKESAHVHDEPHLLVQQVTGAQYVDDGGVFAEFARNADGEVAVYEEVDASGFICHDCGRGLVNDAGEAPLLVCPKLQGRKHGLKPKKDAAAECGQPGA